MTTPLASPTVSIPASHADLLERAVCGVLTTMGRDGQPQSSMGVDAGDFDVGDFDVADLQGAHVRPRELGELHRISSSIEPPPKELSPWELCGS